VTAADLDAIESLAGWLGYAASSRTHCHPMPAASLPLSPGAGDPLSADRTLRTELDVAFVSLDSR